jgi:hypothetical protein
MVWVLLLWTLTTARAQEPAAPAPDPVPAAPDPAPPAEPPPAEPIHPVTSPFEVVLQEATRLYVSGDVRAALLLLEELQRRLFFGEQVPPEVGAEALVYLGEIYLGQGLSQPAKDAFRGALALSPTYEVNPYHHPVEVGASFERVRKQLQAEAAARAAPPPPPPPPLPWWGYAPFGAPQIGQGQTGRGLVYGSLQLGFGAGSVAVMYRLRDENGTWWAPRAWTEDDYEDGWRRVQLQRWAVQYPVTLAFYGVWALSVADGRDSWRRQPAVVIGTTPSGSGPSLTLGWRL